MSGINIIQEIGSTPNYAYFNSHYFCDYIELLALINNTDIVSASDIYTKYLEDGKIGDIGSDEGSDTNDKWSSRISEWFILLEQRQIKFADSYPFIIISDNIKLKATISNQQNSYLLLLLSATRKYVRDNNLLTTDFERISYEVLKSYLPDFAKTFQFGKSNISYDRYTGHITNKIDSLANDLKCKTRYEEHYFAGNNTGDGGLDIVAWVPFPEDKNQKNIQVYLGQCATGKDWLDKQDDTQKFPNKYITFAGEINYIMFIPYDGRNSDGHFSEDAKMGKYLLFDRFRLLQIMDNHEFIESLPSFSLVQQAIEFEEDIV